MVVVGNGQAIDAQNSAGFVVTDSQFNTTAPAMTLTGSPGVEISDSIFDEFSSDGENDLPMTKPFILIEGGGNTSQGSTPVTLVKGNTFTGNSPYDQTAHIVVRDEPGEAQPIVTLQNNTFTGPNPIDVGGDGPNSTDPNGPGGTPFPDTVVATPTATGTEVTGQIRLATDKVGVVEIYTQERLASGLVRLTPTGVFQVTGTPTGEFEINLPAPDNPPPGTTVRLTYTDPSGNTSELSPPVPVHAAPPAEGALDYGDAPDTYRTLAASGGPAHVIKPGIHLGLTVDADGDGQPSPYAVDDNRDKDGPDEDGVVMRLAQVDPRDPSTWVLSGAVYASAAGFLTVMADKNGDGSFSASSEMLTTDFVTQREGATGVYAGVNQFSFSLSGVKVPIGGHLYVRFRFSTAKEALNTASAPDGEVEDHAFLLQGPESQGSLGAFVFDDRHPTLIFWNKPKVVLQRAEKPEGPYKDLFDATSPHIEGSDEPDSPVRRFFRLFTPPK